MKKFDVFLAEHSEYAAAVDQMTLRDTDMNARLARLSDDDLKKVVWGASLLLAGRRSAQD